MKKIVTILAGLCIGTAANSQTPITIAASDMPSSTALSPHALVFASFSQPAPSRGTNQTWRYDTVSSASLTFWGYAPESRSFFTSAGINFRASANKNFGNFTYPYSQEINYGTSEVKIAGAAFGNFLKQPIPGTTSDSLSANSDSAVVTNGVTILKFPFTYANYWSSMSSRFSFNFTFYIPSLSSSPKVIQHVFHTQRMDTTVGWGKLRVNAAFGTSLGVSIYYDVLMNRSLSYNIDSFYSGGSPMTSSDPYLSNLGLVQGAYVDSSRQTLFYRKGSFTPILWLFHNNSDYNYSQAVAALIDSNVTRDVTNVDQVTKGTFISVLYPNPAKDVVNMMLTGKNIDDASYTIFDVTGRIVQSGVVEVRANNVSIPLGSLLINGNYILSVSDRDKTFEVKEEFQVVR